MDRSESAAELSRLDGAESSTSEAPAPRERYDDEHFLRELDEQIIPLSRNLFRQFTRLSESVSASGLHLLKMITLMEHPTAKELAKNTLITPAAASQLLSQLIESGFVSRERSIRDRRSFTLVLTDEGRRVIEENRRLRSRVLSRHFACLDPEERLEFIRIMRKIRANQPLQEEESSDYGETRTRRGSATR